MVPESCQTCRETRPRSKVAGRRPFARGTPARGGQGSGLPVQDLPGPRYPGRTRHPPAVRETAVPELSDTPGSQHLFRTAPPAGSHGQGRPGRVSENDLQHAEHALGISPDRGCIRPILPRQRHSSCLTIKLGPPPGESLRLTQVTWVSGSAAPPRCPTWRMRGSQRVRRRVRLPD